MDFDKGIEEEGLVAAAFMTPVLVYVRLKSKKPHAASTMIEKVTGTAS